MNSLLLYGGGGHQNVIKSIMLDLGYQLQGIFDDNIHANIPSKLKLGSYQSNVFIHNQIIISIGDNQIRKQKSKIISHSFSTLVHPSAIIDKSVIIQKGTVIMQGAVIQVNVTIGEHCIINTNSTIDHDCIIDEFVHISPGATLCGGVQVGSGTLIGSNSTILPGVKIGKNCKVGAGSVVLNDVSDNLTIVGNPGKVIK